MQKSFQNLLYLIVGILTKFNGRLRVSRQYSMAMRVCRCGAKCVVHKRYADFVCDSCSIELRRTGRRIGPCSSRTRKAVRYAKSHVNNWQPRQTKEEYQDYLNSTLWKEKRKEIFSKRGRKCEACGDISGINVHHVIYSRLRREEANDVRVLCGNCHFFLHYKYLPKKFDQKIYIYETDAFILRKQKRVQLENSSAS
jgi:hypothetical protein